ncbi:deoxyribodipyrimidine photolyase [Corynebacterium sp. 13CS0277]|uniref:cryptochrome/photolyase family protein n=1 Tax=Corynebacterium sp. 13CS0277 TaxID=2071994 RepID=UPI000D03F079|nr:deoxyribodipyrimidine photo-lyase [Corynebacterium sp. 13CS0277]PRQ10447.1 deoxyribodipyrimidine photolyase [Corynebacterium sp. 13CS0277]
MPHTPAQTAPAPDQAATLTGDLAHPAPQAPCGAGPAITWLRSDLRAHDHPALEQADGPAVFIRPTHASPARRALWEELLADMRHALGDRLVVEPAPTHPTREARWAATADTLLRHARAAGAEEVLVQADYTPKGLARDKTVAEILATGGVRLRALGSGYAVPPGTLRTGAGGHYKVFTPFYRAWLDCGADAPTSPAPATGASRAWDHWEEFRRHRLAGYAEHRDLPAVDGTSRISAYLATGALHPRTLLASLAATDEDTAPAEDRVAFARELAFREFYADFVYHRPETLQEDVNPRFAGFTWNTPGEDLEVWKEGRTGYPIVDAGMRQLAATGWMHNRVRMLVASFLTKDLHLPWQVGAGHFRELLVDYDPAINQHSWQWCAGTGTDASPYFRIFNPLTQGKKFDPDATYITRWVPELAGVPAADIHSLRNLPAAYPRPMVDHAEERRVALARYEAVKGN